jgi:predicted dehydrogenase
LQPLKTGNQNLLSTSTTSQVGRTLCEGTLGRKGTGKISLNGIPLEFDPIIPFDGEIQDFAAAIRDKRDPEVSGLSGLQIVDDMLRAVDEG